VTPTGVRESGSEGGFELVGDAVDQPNAGTRLAGAGAGTQFEPAGIGGQRHQRHLPQQFRQFDLQFGSGQRGQEAFQRMRPGIAAAMAGEHLGQVVRQFRPQAADIRYQFLADADLLGAVAIDYGDG
jgi:hypothetical protein